MSFDISALKSFRYVNLGCDNAIANLGEGGKIRVTSAAGSARLVRAEGERSVADGV